MVDAQAQFNARELCASAMDECVRAWMFSFFVMVSGWRNKCWRYAFATLCASVKQIDAVPLGARTMVENVSA